MKKLLITASLFLVLIFVSTAVLLMVDGGTRYNAFRFLAESQHLVFEKRLGRAIAQKDFKFAVSILDSRADKLQELSPGNNALTSSYFESLLIAYQATASQIEKEFFIDLFQKLNKSYPQRYDLKVMYAEALMKIDSEKALSSVDSAINLLSSYPAAYRLGIKIAWENQKIIKLNEYCSLYEKNQNGGIKFADMDANQMQELALRRFAIFTSFQGQQYFVENNSLQIGKQLNYEFSLPLPIEISKSIYLFLPLLEGTLFKISKVDFIFQGKKINSVTSDEIEIYSPNGYFLDDNQVLLSKTSKPEVIELMFDKSFSKTLADQLILTITFSKPNIFSSSMCQK